MKQRTLFFDFDGVKFDTTQHHVDYINNRFAIKSVISDYINNPPLDKIVKKYLPEDTEIDATDLYRGLSKLFLDSIDSHETVFPIDGMVQTIFSLSKIYNLVTVTARPDSGRHVIEHMLHKYVPGCISEIHCVWTYKNNEFVPVTKKEFIQNYPGKKVAFLDDSATEIKKLQEIIPSYLFDPCGYNDHETTIQRRVRSWQEFGNLFL
jgi:hypothetical protein